MVFDITMTYAVGTVFMTLGTVVLLTTMAKTSGRDRTLYAILAAIPGIAAVAYAVMTLGIGTLTVNGNTVFAPRYIDWLFTTVLLVLYVGMVAGASRDVLAKLVAADVSVIVFGVVATMITPPVKYGAFAIATGAFAALLYLLFGPTTTASESQPYRVTALAKKLRNVIGVLWLIYPIAWATGPAALGLMNVGTMAVVIMYLDVVSKVGFGLIALNGVQTIEQAQQSEPAAETVTA
ncbi:MAG: bacteriorhodopsin [Halobacteriales archaeon]